MLKETFLELLFHFSDDTDQAHELWAEIETNYSEKKRHYHTLSHLSSLLHQLLEVKDHLESWKPILFSLFYHDLIYSPLKSDNEEKSSRLAERRMNQLQVPAQIIERCKAQILATKTHLEDTTTDTNYFTDADLSILGQPSEVYIVYSQNVRKEYSIYPDFIYNQGRKKVLKYFLAMDRIYKTPYFFDKFELQARENVSVELKML
jgi:predicted metal-dependent HD superfamily phosphohydrolase